MWKYSFMHEESLVNAVMYAESLVISPDGNWEEEELRGEATYVEKFISGSAPTWKRAKDDSSEYFIALRRI
ncbi:hypothetical protein CsSME_00016395 [Camellia sinensis var. sinensis]